MIGIYFILIFGLYLMLKMMMEDYLQLKREVTRQINSKLSRVEHVFPKYEHCVFYY